MLPHAQAQSGLRQDQEFRARVHAVHIGAGIGFGIAERLRFLQRCVEARAIFFHLREDEIAGAVENSRDFVKPVAGKAFLNADNRRNSARDRRAKFKPLAHFSRKVEQLGAGFGDQQLVGGNDGFARAQRLAHPLTGRLEASDKLDHDVHIGRKHVVNIFGPADVCRQRADFFLLDAAIENVREEQRTVGIQGKNLRHGAAHGAKADEADFQAPVRTREFLHDARFSGPGFRRAR